MVLTRMVNQVATEWRLIIECSNDPWVAPHCRSIPLRRDQAGAAELSWQTMADVLVGVGKLSSMGMKLVLTWIGGIFQRLCLSGMSLGRTQAWVVA